MTTANLTIEKIGGMFFVVSPAFESTSADENGNLFRPATIISKPYTTQAGAKKALKAL